MDDDIQPSLIQRLIRFLGRRRLSRSARIEKEIQHLIGAGEEEGLITLQEGDMIQGVLELGGMITREILVPRTEIVGVPLDASLEDIIGYSNEYGHTRYPVFTDNLDHIEGILHLKDLLRFWGKDASHKIVPEAMKPAHFVHGGKAVNELLREMLDDHIHMVIVTDEYGGTDGLLTVEDIIEEIVGEIHDEHDREVDMISRIDENTFLADARVDIEDLEDSLEIKFPQGNYESLGGFLVECFGRVPASEEEYAYQGLTFTIESADQRRIEQVRIARNRPSQTN